MKDLEARALHAQRSSLKRGKGATAKHKKVLLACCDFGCFSIFAQPITEISNILSMKSYLFIFWFAKLFRK